MNVADIIQVFIIYPLILSKTFFRIIVVVILFDIFSRKYLMEKFPKIGLYLFPLVIFSAVVVVNTIIYLKRGIIVPFELGYYTAPFTFLMIERAIYVVFSSLRKMVKST